MNSPQTGMLADGRRLHLNHGPIDLIVEAFGPDVSRRTAYRLATERFATILGELARELPQLRKPASRKPRAFQGPVARRMEAAVGPVSARFITPMAAVAGSVADEILAAMAPAGVSKTYVNNGGDIAFALTPGETLSAAIGGPTSGRLTIRFGDPVRGIATSGWRGRSFSLGIADAVTVLAADAAMADAAATLIANAVDIPGHPAITRRRADLMQPDTDLGARLVTTGVGQLTDAEVGAALGAGVEVAEEFRSRGLIVGAALFLGGTAEICGAKMSMLRVAPSVLPDISSARGGDRQLRRWRLANLPPCGGDVRQDRGGRDRVLTIQDKRHA